MRLLPLLAPALAAVALHAPARADAVLSKLLEEARATQPAGFERTTRFEQRGRDPVVRVDRFDPRRPAGQQWSLVSVDGAPPTEEQRQQHARQVAGQPVPGFHRLHELLAGEPTSVDRQGSRIVYRWAALQRGAAPSGQGPDFSTRLSAEAHVETSGPRPVLQRVRVFAAQGFPVAAVARINAFEAVSDYRLEGGVHRMTRQTTDVDARIPLRGAAVTRTLATFQPL